MSKKYTTTSEQIEKIKSKYGNLIYAIAYRIGGDAVTNSFEDSVQNLYISAMDACEAYERKTGITFDDFFGSEEFGKYIKSTLWNKKNNVGKKITKKLNINSHLSLDENLLGDESMYEGVDVSALSFDVLFEEDTRELVELIIGDYSMIKPSGDINISKASRELGIDKRELKNRLNALRFNLRDYHDGL
jgi:hypothetical protein